MEQQSNNQINRYRNRANKYKQQRDAVVAVALIVILALSIVHQIIFDKQADNFDQLEEVVQSYRERCSQYHDQIIDLTQQVQLLEYQNKQLRDKDKDKNIKLFFVPDDWTLNTKQAAKIYKSIPLDKNLQEYTWQLCVYLDIPECYETCLAIMWQETNYNPDLVSETDDYGLMQINECNLNSLKDTIGITDIMAIDQNICSGVYLFTLNYRQFGNTNEALMAYNMGPSATKNCLSNGTYSTDYSRSVISKTQMILQDEYDPLMA